MAGVTQGQVQQRVDRPPMFEGNFSYKLIVAYKKFVSQTWAGKGERVV